MSAPYPPCMEPDGEEPCVQYRQLVEALAVSEAREKTLSETLRWREIAKEPPPPETDVLLYDPDADWWPIVGFLDDEGWWVHSAKEQTIFPTQWRPVGPLPDAPAPETGDGR